MRKKTKTLSQNIIIKVMDWSYEGSQGEKYSYEKLPKDFRDAFESCITSDTLSNASRDDK